VSYFGQLLMGFDMANEECDKICTYLTESLSYRLAGSYNMWGNKFGPIFFGKMCCLLLQGDLIWFRWLSQEESLLCDLMEELKEYLQLNGSLCDRLKTAYWGRWMQKKV